MQWSRKRPKATYFSDSMLAETMTISSSEVAVEAEVAAAVVEIVTDLPVSLAVDVVVAEVERWSSTTAASQVSLEHKSLAKPALREVKVKYLSLSHAPMCSRTLQSAY